MIDLGLFMLIVWVLKNGAEDLWTLGKGETNPRIERRKARQKSRASNPIWTQLVGWAGDITEDARQDAADSRRRKREKRQRDRELAEQREQAERERAEAEQAEREQAEREQAEREQAEREQAEGEQAEAERAQPADYEAGCRSCGWLQTGLTFAAAQAAAGAHICPPSAAEQSAEVDIPLDDPKEEQEQEQQPEQDGSEPASPGADPLPDNVIPFNRPKKFNPKEYRMSTQVNGEVTGLDPAISYAKSLAMFAGEHGQAGNEGYIGFLQQSKVEGAALDSAYEMQAAFSDAQDAAERHRQQLAQQKTVQEAYNLSPDAGDKQFQTNGQ